MNDEITTGLTDSEMLRFEVYRDKREEIRWRAIARNNRVIAESGEGYRNLADAEWALGLVKRGAQGAAITYAERVP
jgi:uncharacterized protein